MTPLKTFHITNAWHATSGGISTFYRALLDAANSCGHLLRLAVPGDRDRVEDVGTCGRIYYLKAPAAPLNASYRVMYPHLYLRRSGTLRRLLHKESPNLVEVCDKYTLPFLTGCLRIGAFRGLNPRPVTVGLSCERMDENVEHYLRAGAAGALLARHFMKWVYFPMFDHHIAVSEHTAGELRVASRGHKVRRAVWTFPMGVDTDAFHPSNRSTRARQWLVERCDALHDSVLLLYAGRLAPEKNLPVLIDMLGLLGKSASTDYRLLIAGDGMLLGELMQLARTRTPGRVTFLGFQNRRTLADVYAGADIFVHPNPKEPFGIAPLEAMASGLPLVAPESGGILTYANSSNSWLCDGSPEAFCRTVCSIAKNPDDRVRRVERGRKTAESYSWSAVAQQYLTLYEDLCRFPETTRARPAFYSTVGDRFGREIKTAFSQGTETE